jgi:hypothetical protein
MELYTFTSKTTIMLKITGNSRFKILNDVENKLIDVKYIIFDNKTSHIFLNTACYSNKLLYKLRTHNKYYIKFTYNNKKPIITYMWNYNKFTPYYVIYPIAPISNNLKKIFPNANINNIKINNYELNKNKKILDDEYHNNWKYHIKQHKDKIKYPNIVSIYGCIISI